MSKVRAFFDSVDGRVILAFVMFSVGLAGYNGILKMPDEILGMVFITGFNAIRDSLAAPGDGK